MLADAGGAPRVSSRATSRAARGRDPALVAAAFVAFTAALWILYGPTHVGYDGMWALNWGGELASGQLPSFQAHWRASTPHPAINALATLFAPLGKTAAPIAFDVTGIACLAALALVCARMGSLLFALPVGAFFTLLVLTQPRLLHEVMFSPTEVAFAALMLAALMLVVEDPRRGWAPLGFLAAAGLVRPEAWGFALLYGAYVVFVVKPPRRLALAGLALVGPFVWLLVDLVVTGTPFYSLLGTREFAEQLNRETGLLAAVVKFPAQLGGAAGQPMAWLALVGWAVALWVFFDRVWIPSLVVALSLGGYLALGLAELPLQPRYLVVAGLVLDLFVAVLVFGWTALERGRARSAWMAASLVPLALFLLSVPAQLSRIDEERTESAASHAAQRDLEQLVTSPGARRAFRECGPVYVSDFRVRPFVWYWAGVEPRAIEDGRVGQGKRGTYVSPGLDREAVSAAARTGFFKAKGSPLRPLLTPPPGAQVAARTDAWRIDVVGCRLPPASRIANPGARSGVEGSAPSSTEGAVYRHPYG